MTMEPIAEKDAGRGPCEVTFCGNGGDPYTVTADETGRARTTAMGHLGWTASTLRRIPQHVTYCPMHALDLLGTSVLPPAECRACRIQACEIEGNTAEPHTCLAPPAEGREARP